MIKNKYLFEIVVYRVNNTPEENTPEGPESIRITHIQSALNTINYSDL